VRRRRAAGSGFPSLLRGCPRTTNVFGVAHLGQGQIRLRCFLRKRLWISGISRMVSLICQKVSGLGFSRACSRVNLTPNRGSSLAISPLVTGCWRCVGVGRPAGYVNQSLVVGVVGVVDFVVPGAQNGVDEHLRVARVVIEGKPRI